jgi:hypothetical protein
VALIAVACGGETPTAETPTEAPPAEGETETEEEETTTEEEAEPFRVAVVMPSAINDLAFSQSMYDALLAIQEERGEENFQFDFSENMFVVDDAAAAIRDYASQGYDLIVAHGSQYGSTLREIVPDFPETSFAHGTTVETFVDEGIDNVYAYEARSEQGGYVNGVIAASLSESNTLGVVGPIETGDAKLYVDGFVAGAEATNPDVRVNVNYIGSFSDVGLASEAASTHVNAGADALTGNTNGSLTRLNRYFKSITLEYRGTISYPREGAITSDFTFGAQGFRDEESRVWADAETFALPGTEDIGEAGNVIADELREQVFNGGVFFKEQLGYEDRLFFGAGLRFDGNSAFGDEVGVLPAFHTMTNGVEMSPDAYRLFAIADNEVVALRD